jgi:flavin reductase (DIM6/NTAB) family NADH-FMN oxidoreductase RutF
VQKLQQKIQQATLDLNTLPTTPTQPDAATLAAAEQALARLAAKKQQSPEEKQQALKESIEKRIQQLHLRISTSDADKIPILNESLAALEARLKELER